MAETPRDERHYPRRHALRARSRLGSLRRSPGFRGLIESLFEPLTARSVDGIIQQGGTILGSTRSPEFQTEEGWMEPLRQLHQQEIEALVVIGGNGSH